MVVSGGGEYGTVCSCTWAYWPYPVNMQWPPVAGDQNDYYYIIE